MIHRSRRLPISVTIAAILGLLLPIVVHADNVTTLVNGTAVLLSQTSSGNGGNTSSTTSSTNIFSPAAYVDYKRFGGEPTVVVDRYPYTTGNVIPSKQSCTTLAPCPPTDTIYASSPNGFVYPHYSPFWKSDDLGQTFRVPQHLPIQGQLIGQGGGGGDSHIAVGQVTHKVFFVDLPGGGCDTMNISSNQGESFTQNPLGCGLNEGAIDDRPWVEADETFPMTQNVYVSFINFTNDIAPTLALAKSTDDGTTFAGDCNLATDAANPILPAALLKPAACPDPNDPRLQVGGPVIADKNANSPCAHDLYIPFARGGGQTAQVSSSPPWDLWVAISKDGGNTWTQQEVAILGDHNPVNLFPQITVDRGGNLYYTWSQTMGPGTDSSGTFDGEQDVLYKYSTNCGTTWTPTSPPQPSPMATPQQLASLPLDGIDLTKETGDSAVMPWMVAGDPGQVDLVYYKANSGLNSNVPDSQVWNVYFAQSNNALNTGPNFNSVQISDHPNHIGQICTSGLGCSAVNGNRDLLDFFTVDIDHLGAANVIWADDNNAFSSTRDKFSRQISGNSVFKGQTINLQSSWPITNHAVTDRLGDVYDGAGFPKGPCPGMDLLGTSEQQSNGTITIGLTLNGPPTFMNAIGCSTADTPATGGIWGAEFWASASPSKQNTQGGPDNFYIAYRDDGGTTDFEGGRIEALNLTVTGLEFQPLVTGRGSACVPVSNPPPGAPQACTISISVPACSLGIKPGTGLYSITGLSAYQFDTQKPQLVAFEGGNSEQADAATAFDDNGTGTTSSACS